MTFKDSVRICLTEKYASPHGRATRSEYWWFILFNIVLCLAAFIVGAALFGDGGAAIFIGLAGLGILIPSIMVSIRRLHDRNMRGWWLLLTFIPNIGQLILTVIYILPSTEGPNRFGPDPHNPATGFDNHSDLGLSQSSIPRVGRDD